MSQPIQRRTFLEFLGKGAIGATLFYGVLPGCKEPGKPIQGELTIPSVAPSSEDQVLLSEGLHYDVLLKWEDPISASDRFGFNNDFIAFLPQGEGTEEGLLWVNHEYIDPKFVSDHWEGAKSKEQVEKEQYNVGGTIVRIRKNESGKWEVAEDQRNRRIHAATEIPFNWPEPIMGQDKAIGTLANCSGGLTPWGTILTCEENYDGFYGERNHKTGAIEINEEDDYGWRPHFDFPPEHYGWVVEIDPQTGEAQKHIALGRCAHECATVVSLPDDRLVVYTGDDANDECLYKFIGSRPKSLSEGTLYVANLENGRWESLSIDEQPVLKENFKNQTEVLIRLREASKLVGGTPLDRPEDIEIDPLNRNVLIALTNNKPKGNYYGSILKIEEGQGDHTSLQFQSSTYLAGGTETGFACPDNMAFDKAGNLWFTSDISGSSINKGEYVPFKNNGLFLVPRSGQQAGEVLQIASAPNDAELTGPFFSPDGTTLFLSVQHPGETTETPDQYTSNWPDGGNAMPRPAVIAIQGELLKKVQGIS
jgi:secreted PhoX family phosphatase